MNLTEDQLEEFDEAFNFFDSDRDGLINEKELGKVFQFTRLNYRMVIQWYRGIRLHGTHNDYLYSGTVV